MPNPRAPHPVCLDCTAPCRTLDVMVLGVAVRSVPPAAAGKGGIRSEPAGPRQTITQKIWAADGLHHLPPKDPLLLSQTAGLL
jgi:hypothetical protein